MDARHIPTSPDTLSANVQGEIEAPEGVLKITRISCHFNLKVPLGKKEAAIRALNVFERNCPVAQTLKGGVAIENTWNIEEIS
nr:OsmC family protein [Fictibacillus solisalsi]